MLYVGLVVDLQYEPRQLLKLVFTPACTVTVYHLQYETVGGQGEATTASGALMVPRGTDPSCQGPLPVVLYAHGTSASKSYDIANLSDTSNSAGLLMATVFSARGYIVVAPNYAERRSELAKQIGLGTHRTSAR